MSFTGTDYPTVLLGYFSDPLYFATEFPFDFIRDPGDYVLLVVP